MDEGKIEVGAVCWAGAGSQGMGGEDGGSEGMQEGSERGGGGTG